MSMILYNIRYRGPYEYDKFILNTLQLCNELKLLSKHFDESSLTKILVKQQELNDLFDDLVKENSDLETLLIYKEKVNNIV